MKPDLDAIRARCEAATPGPWAIERYSSPHDGFLIQYRAYKGETETVADIPLTSDAELIAAARTDIPALLAHIDTLEHMLGEERENVDTLRARVAELEAEAAILRPWYVMLKRAHGALTDAGCVVPLEFDQSIEHAIKDLARRATRAEQLFVDEYDARRDVERQRDELQARITTLEAMR